MVDRPNFVANVFINIEQGEITMLFFGWLKKIWGKRHGAQRDAATATPVPTLTSTVAIDYSCNCDEVVANGSKPLKAHKIAVLHRCSKCGRCFTCLRGRQPVGDWREISSDTHSLIRSVNSWPI